MNSTLQNTRRIILPSLSKAVTRPSLSYIPSRSMMSGIDDREKALEEMYIREAEKKVMEKLQKKLAAAQKGEVLVNDEKHAEDELKGLLGKNVDEATIKSLLEWKKKAH